MNTKEMPMTEAIATIAGQMRKAYLIRNVLLTSGIASLLLIYFYKFKNTKI